MIWVQNYNFFSNQQIIDSDKDISPPGAGLSGHGFLGLDIAYATHIMFIVLLY
jgi:hypothetical protein